MPGIFGNFGCEHQRMNVSSAEKVINVDIRDTVGADVICNLAMPLPFEDRYFDGIFASHVLEHFSYKSTIDILREWRRTLKFDGTIEIHVPSFEYIIDQYHKTKRIPLPELYGGQGHIYDVHLCCFDSDSMREILYEAGFTGVKMSFEDYWGHKNLSLVGKAINPKE